MNNTPPDTSLDASSQPSSLQPLDTAGSRAGAARSAPTTGPAGHHTVDKRVLARVLAARTGTNSGTKKSGAGVPIVRVPRDREDYPCSAEQRRIWLTVQMDQAETTMPHATSGLRLRGPLDQTALTGALADLTERHETLRTVFVPGLEPAESRPDPASSGPRQRVLSTVEVPLEVTDLTTAADPHARAQQLASSATAETFDLTSGPLLRAYLFRFAADDHALLLVGHHIILDERAVDLVVADLAALYRTRVLGTPAPPSPEFQYLDYADWSLRRFTSEERDRRRAWWRDQLAGPRSELELPFGGAKDVDGAKDVEADQPGGCVTAYLPPGVLDRLRSAGGRSTTGFVAMLTLLKVVLTRYAGDDDLTIGTVSAGRDRTAWEPIVGCFLNMLALRTKLHGTITFPDAVERVRRTVAGSVANQLPLDEVVAEAHPERASSHPLFSVTFALMSDRDTTIGTGEDWAGLQVEVWHHRVEPGGMDLTIEATPARDGSVALRLKYHQQRFDTEAMERFARHIETLASNLAADPHRRLDQVTMLPAKEQDELRDLGAGEPMPVPEQTVLDLFRKQVAATPDATAVVAGQIELTYRELAARVDRLAAKLIDAGVRPGALVALCLERTVDLAAAPLAVWAAGAAWVPVDPDYPADRQALVIADSGASVLLAHSSAAGRLPDHRATVVYADQPEPDPTGQAPPTGDLPDPEGSTDAGTTPAPAGIAYLLYTSGSTGRPKGVQVSHHNLTNFILAMRELVGGQADHRWLAITSLAFDIAGLELWLPLVTGASLVVVPDEMVRDGEAVARLVNDRAVDHIQTTPSTWRLLLAGGLHRPHLVALVGGEALPLPLARELRGITDRLINVYGPTETTIWSTSWEVPAEVHEVTIGTPIANTQVYLLDRHGQLTPRGVSGELCIGGDGVAQGYRDRPGLTAQRFVPDPYGGQAGGRLYRTGDRVRWRADGTLEFLGRIDNQVKVRGHRIEPGEIEAHLVTHPSVSQAAVVLRPDHTGEPTLVGYVTSAAGASTGAQELRQHLSQTLPAYMVPPYLITLDSLPLTPNGKLDRASLPAPEQVSSSAPGQETTLTQTEQLVVEIWGTVLGISDIGVNDDFFELGGHSLLALRMVGALREAIGLAVPVRLCFQHPTVSGLAAAVEKLILSEIEAMPEAEANAILTGSGE